MTDYDGGTGLEAARGGCTPATTRRGFLAGAACLIGAGAVLPTHAELATSAALAASRDLRLAPQAPARSRASQAVVSFALDRPYLDASGRGLPYRAPAGAGAATGLEHHASADFIGQFGYC